MKIEIAESLFYSWLRHVKECQIAQNNWKVSPSWALKNVNKLQQIYDELRREFKTRFNYDVLKLSLDQFFRQAECDAIGMALNNGQVKHYAVDVAYHGNGLGYGNPNVSTCKVVEKCIRNALCLYGYFEAEEAEIVFASPKIGKYTLILLTPAINYLNTYFQNVGMKYTFKLLYGGAFFNEVIDPIRIVSGQVKDTAELFMRAYQLLDMFRQSSFLPVIVKGMWSNPTATPASQNPAVAIPGATAAPASQNPAVAIPGATATPVSQNPAVTVPGAAAYDTLKVGLIARTALKRMLESGLVPDDEIKKLLTAEDSKAIFGINYPLLSETGGKHYYVAPLIINGKKYYLCDEWYAANKQKLIDWIKAHPEVEEYIYFLDAMPEESEESEED